MRKPQKRIRRTKKRKAKKEKEVDGGPYTVANEGTDAPSDKR